MRRERAAVGAALSIVLGMVAPGALVWVIAERRFVYLQGCVRDATQAARAEAIAKAAPDVQVVIAAISVPGQAPRYPLAKARR